MSLRIFLSLLGVTLVGLVQAQVPDVLTKLDVALTYRSEVGGASTLRTWDLMGRHSTVGLTLFLEPGLTATFNQRLQRIANDPDGESIDEAYIEDPGYWRIGKQYMRFGSGRMLRESVNGGRLDTRVGADAIPVVISVGDGGEDMPRAIYTRIGGRIGVSGAFGERIGNLGTDLALLRSPDAPRRGEGYRAVVGVDYASRSGLYRIEAEAVVFRDGMTPEDRPRDVTDLAATLRPSPTRSLTLGWSRDWRQKRDRFRVQARYRVLDNLILEPMLRMEGSEVWDVSLTARLRL